MTRYYYLCIGGTAYDMVLIETQKFQKFLPLYLPLTIFAGKYYLSTAIAVQSEDIIFDPDSDGRFVSCAAHNVPLTIEGGEKMLLPAKANNQIDGGAR
jgi:hypothetical protein